VPGPDSFRAAPRSSKPAAISLFDFHRTQPTSALAKSLSEARTLHAFQSGARDLARLDRRAGIFQLRTSWDLLAARHFGTADGWSGKMNALGAALPDDSPAFPRFSLPSVFPVPCLPRTFTLHPKMECPIDFSKDLVSRNLRQPNWNPA